jgi:hypothetical protein
MTEARAEKFAEWLESQEWLPRLENKAQERDQKKRERKKKPPS